VLHGENEVFSIAPRKNHQGAASQAAGGRGETTGNVQHPSLNIILLLPEKIK
jgi:hypothetical protein